MNLRRFFAELISRTSATRFSSQLLCLHLSGAILRRSNTHQRGKSTHVERDFSSEKGSFGLFHLPAPGKMPTMTPILTPPELNSNGLDPKNASLKA